MNVYDYFQKQADERPGQPAIIDTVLVHDQAADRIVTYDELQRAVVRYATYLIRAGLRPGEGVLIFQTVSLELFIALLAILRCGMVPIFIEQMFDRRDLRRVCEMFPPRALLADFKTHAFAFMSRSLRRIPVRLGIGDGPWLPGSEGFHRIEPDFAQPEIERVLPHAPALIRFYVAEDEEPRATVSTHRMLQHQVQVHRDFCRLQPGHRDLCSSFALALSNLLSGLTTILPDLQPRRSGAEAGLEPLRRQVRLLQPTRATGSNLLFTVLERLPETLKTLDHVVIRDTHCSLSLMRRLCQAAPDARIISLYQLPEADPVCLLDAHDITDTDVQAVIEGKGYLLGKPVPDLQVRILDIQHLPPGTEVAADDFREAIQPPFLPGQIVMTGPHVQTGYLRGHGDSERKLRVRGNVWHRSGDFGYCDGEGRFWASSLQSSRQDLPAESWFPTAIEAAARENPQVTRAFAVRRDGRRYLFVEMVRDLGESAQSREKGAAALITLRSQLQWAHIEKIFPVENLPRDIPHENTRRLNILRKFATDRHF